ncbi:MAG: hypothetical protein RSI33_00980, partial [Clostridia bacterium]
IPLAPMQEPLRSPRRDTIHGVRPVGVHVCSPTAQFSSLFVPIAAPIYGLALPDKIDITNKKSAAFQQRIFVHHVD